MVQEQKPEWLADTGEFLDGGELSDVRRDGREALIRFVKDELEARSDEDFETEREAGMKARTIVDSFTEDEYCDIRVDVMHERENGSEHRDGHTEHLAYRMVEEFSGE